MAVSVESLMRKRENIRNLGVIAHIDHGKSTFSDNLLSGAGMLSEELAGKQLYTDFDKQEQERGITIFSANVSIVYPYGGTDYLINLIDTPGHVDFGADVTRAMRAVDGAIVVICAVAADRIGTRYFHTLAATGNPAPDGRWQPRRLQQHVADRRTARSRSDSDSMPAYRRR